MSDYVLHFDGSISKNPNGIAAYGYVVRKNGEIWADGSESLGSGPYSNNYAELYGAYKGLEIISQHVEPGDRIFVRGDSQLAINLLHRRFRARQDKLYYPAYKLADTLIRKLRNELKCFVSFEWLPRELNQEADKLSKWNAKREVVQNEKGLPDLLRNEKSFQEYLDIHD
jgi:ribonuclease HI